MQLEVPGKISHKYYIWFRITFTAVTRVMLSRIIPPAQILSVVIPQAASSAHEQLYLTQCFFVGLLFGSSIVSGHAWRFPAWRSAEHLMTGYDGSLEKRCCAMPIKRDTKVVIELVRLPPAFSGFYHMCESLGFITIASSGETDIQRNAGLSVCISTTWNEPLIDSSVQTQSLRISLTGGRCALSS